MAKRKQILRLVSHFNEWGLCVYIRGEKSCVRFTYFALALSLSLFVSALFARQMESALSIFSFSRSLVRENVREVENLLNFGFRLIHI